MKSLMRALKTAEKVLISFKYSAKAGLFKSDPAAHGWVSFRIQYLAMPYGTPQQSTTQIREAVSTCFTVMDSPLTPAALLPLTVAGEKSGQIIFYPSSDQLSHAEARGPAGSPRAAFSVVSPQVTWKILLQRDSNLGSLCPQSTLVHGDKPVRR